MLLCLIIPLALHAGELREIVLVDGSVIVGELVSLTDGIYTINSATLGTLQVEGARVKTIGNVSGRTAGPDDAAGRQQIMQIQKEMLADGSVMQLILALQNDPDFQEILQDESILAAINAGDFNGLMNNPKIIKLMNKPGVQEIRKKME